MSTECYCFIPDYQSAAGPLTEFDPNAILREINDDVNSVINTAMQFIETSELGNLEFMLKRTFAYVSTELSMRGITLDKDSALVYGSAIENIGREFVLAVSAHPAWFTRYGKWMGARYSTNSPQAVEFMLDYQQVKFPQYEVLGAYAEISPNMLNVVNMLIGSLGGKL